MDTTAISFSEPAQKILKERYLHTDEGGHQEKISDMFMRVASTIAKADAKYKVLSKSDLYTITQKFFKAMIDREFIPNSPTLMNAGLDNGLQYSACYVLPVEDSIEGIFDSVKHAALIHKSGGGTGFSFDRLRPSGGSVGQGLGYASGPVSFMRVFDGATEAIKQGGRRRGANMGVLRVDHPDIEEFITCKLDGGITNFNISVAITDEFMKALEDDAHYYLLARKGWPVEGRMYNHKADFIKAGTKKARKIWDMIIDAAWQTGDPGLIFIDRVNRSYANPLPAIGQIEATNPCGEVPLFPYEACNLGSINLAKFINEQATALDWDALAEIARTAVHFLDNVITVNPYPLPEIEEQVEANRRIGVGVMGWADLIFSLGIPYNSTEARILAKDVMGTIQKAGEGESIRLAKERGPFPRWDKSIYKDQEPRRNCTITTIAPTGSISIIAGASSGIEPAFALAYTHTSNNAGGRVLSFINPVFEHRMREEGLWSDDLKDYVLKTGTIKDYPYISERWKNVFVTAQDIEPEDHIAMQAAFQRNTDNGVSKTINLPNKATRQDIEDAYLLAYETGCLGITVFRDGCKGGGGGQVLNVGAKGGASGLDKKLSGIEDDPSNERTPKVRVPNLPGNTYRKKTPVGTAYITVNANGDKGKEPFEVFINVGKAGSDVAADAEGLGRLISLILRLPGPLSAHERAKDIVGQLRGIGSGRAQGFGQYRVMSLADAVAQAIAEHVGFNATSQLPGLPDVDESAQLPLPLKAGDLCPECGQATLAFEENCKKCYGCGYSEC